MKHFTIVRTLPISLFLSAVAVQAQNEDPAKPRGPAPIVTPEGGKIPTVQPLSPRNTPSVPPGGPLSNPVGGNSSSSSSTSSSSIVPSPLPSRPAPGTPEARAMQQRIDAAGPSSRTTYDPKTNAFNTQLSNGNEYSTKGFEVNAPPHLRRQQGGMIVIPGQGGSSSPSNNNRGGNIYDSTGSPGLTPNRIYDSPDLIKGPSPGTSAPPIPPLPRSSTSVPPIPPLPRDSTSAPPIPPLPRSSTSVPPIPPLPRDSTSAPPIPPSPRSSTSAPPVLPKSPPATPRK